MASDALMTIECVTTAERLRFVASMAIEASTPPFPRSFWSDIAAVAGVDPVELVATAISTGVFAWGAIGDFLVLLRNGEPVASCAGYNAVETPPGPPLRRYRLPELLGNFHLPAERLVAAVAAYDSAWAGMDISPFSSPPAHWIIENVAVVRDARGEGLLAPLIEAVVARGAQRGHTTAGLSVVVGNDRAEIAYRRLGFQVSEIFGPECFGSKGFPGLVKMKRHL